MPTSKFPACNLCHRKKLKCTAPGPATDSGGIGLVGPQLARISEAFDGIAQQIVELKRHHREGSSHTMEQVKVLLVTAQELRKQVVKMSDWFGNLEKRQLSFLARVSGATEGYPYSSTTEEFTLHPTMSIPGSHTDALGGNEAATPDGIAGEGTAPEPSHYRGMTGPGMESKAGKGDGRSENVPQPTRGKEEDDDEDSSHSVERLLHFSRE